ncbi:hypothetical protein C1H46_017919 [Malus baccata]|uniref:Uncharacterized protein n=1 Tax=Malus baccata TaxID=106549 RepID=A0A540MCJ1_MALBA|nr:hypothetical protein C1H46_017919 [Malus baccata]
MLHKNGGSKFELTPSWWVDSVRERSSDQSESKTELTEEEDGGGEQKRGDSENPSRGFHAGSSASVSVWFKKEGEGDWRRGGLVGPRVLARMGLGWPRFDWAWFVR